VPRVHPEGFIVDGGKARAVITVQGEFAGDLFLVGVGVEPNSQIAEDRGAVLGKPAP
jgi:NADPH-dependent 2,4-dienoyl-CoA reductase/sulfur reductase-like enzyme